MNDPWNRFSWWPSTKDFLANAEPSDMSPTSNGGILGNLGQFTEVPPAAQVPPNAPWNPVGALLGQTWAQRSVRPFVETYDPDALKFIAPWRRMYLTPRPPVFGPASDLTQPYSQRNGQWSNSAEPRPLPDANASNGTDTASQLAGWPSVNASEYSMPSAAAIPASYEADARPWWAPVTPPGVFDPWREHASKGLLGLYKFFFDRGSYPSGGNQNGPGCKEEWEEARKQCVELLSTSNPPRGVTGGYRDIEDCARGLVSERCGGNPVKW